MGRRSKGKWFLVGALLGVAVFLAGGMLAPGRVINVVEWLGESRFSGDLWGPPQQVDGIEVAVETVGISRVDRQPLVILKEKESERRLPIWVGPLEANAISVVLERIEVPRPLTADLLISAIREFGAEVEYVAIDDLRESTYYARLVLRGDHSRIEIDARPSDAIAVAVRTGAPIYVNRALMDKSGITPEGRPEKSA